MIEALKKLIDQLLSQKAFPVLAEITNVYTATGQYYVDCEELSNLKEKTGIQYIKADLPKLWGTNKGGIWMTPSVGTIVLLNFLNGDRNFPVVAASMGSQASEAHPEDTMIIKCGTAKIQIDGQSQKISITAGGQDLGRLLKEIADNVAGLTTVGSPATQTLRPDQIAIWKILSGKIGQLLG